MVEGVKQAKTRLIRIFVQEHFFIYPDHNCFDWIRLDAYMDALAATGANVVASICIKPKVLFPQVDHTVWMPNDVAEWQQVIQAMVQRYSVDKPIVTYWEVGNETDIGENGGSPFLIVDPDDYLAFYQMTIEPILKVAPQVKVGGAASCWIDNEPLVGFIERCLRDQVRLDFISWHRYSNNAEIHAMGVEKAKQRLAGFGSQRPEMLYTEWATNFMVVRDSLDPHQPPHPQHVSIQEMAFDPYRAAVTAASILAMMDAGLDWSFYYHIWDQCFYPEEFRPFFSDYGLALMHEHWNEMPHRFGLFGEGGEARPQYFVYWMLARLGEERLAAQSFDPAVRVLATRSEKRISALLTNYHLTTAHDLAAQIELTLPTPGEKTLTVYRIDENRHWTDKPLELIPVEQRTIYAMQPYRCQVYLPANSVVLLELEDKQ